jgi:hypothetical protein
LKSSNKNISNPKNKIKSSNTYRIINQCISLHKKTIRPQDGKNSRIPSFTQLKKKQNLSQENFNSTKKMILPTKKITADQRASNPLAWFQCLPIAKTENT